MNVFHSLRFSVIVMLKWYSLFDAIDIIYRYNEYYLSLSLSLCVCVCVSGVDDVSQCKIYAAECSFTKE